MTVKERLIYIEELVENICDRLNRMEKNYKDIIETINRLDVDDAFNKIQETLGEK